MIELTVTDWYNIAGRGLVAAVDNSNDQLPLDINPSDLAGQEVRLNGKLYYVRAVERQGYSRRYFGLLVRDKQ